MTRLLSLLLVVGVFLLAGCGGGSDTPTLLSRSVQITWPERSRETLLAPTSALSAQVRIVNGGAFGEDILVHANRDPDRSESYVGTYPIQKLIVSSSSVLRVQFYAGPNSGGDIVATAQGTFNSSGDVLDIANIVIDSKIATVTVAPATIHLNSGPTPLDFSAWDGEGHLVAVSPGSAKWRLALPTDAIQLSADGVATPLAKGSGSVIASVDGVDSLPAAVIVDHPFTKAFWFSRQNDTIHLTGGPLAGACDLRPTFTIELVVRPTGMGILWQQWRNSAMNQAMYLDNALLWGMLTTGSGSPVQRFLGGELTYNEWTHIAWCFDGEEMRVYRDGALIHAEASNDASLAIALGEACAIGKNSTVPFETGQWSFSGYLAAFRISSIARYSGATYDPPTGPWTADAPTLMLLDPSSLAGNPTSFSLPGTQGLSAELGSAKGTAPALVGIGG